MSGVGGSLPIPIFGELVCKEPLKHLLWLFAQSHFLHSSTDVNLHINFLHINLIWLSSPGDWPEIYSNFVAPKNHLGSLINGTDFTEEPLLSPSYRLGIRILKRASEVILVFIVGSTLLEQHSIIIHSGQLKPMARLILYLHINLCVFFFIYSFI